MHGRISTTLMQALPIVVISGFLSIAFNLNLIEKALKGELITDINRYQVAALEAKAVKISHEIRFVDLVEARKLFDEKLAVFMDARSHEEYLSGHISAALSAPILAVVKRDLDLGQLLPSGGKVLVTYCSGGLCDTSVELAKELADMGYKNIYVLGDGYPGWEAAGYPVEEGRK